MRHFNWMNFKIKIKTVTKSLVSKKMLTRLFVVAAIFCGCNSYIFSLDFIRTDIDIDLESNSVDNFIDKFEDVIVPDNDVNEDANLTTLQLIRKYGYPSEKHHVITDDGYILELHRIPREGAVPVLLVHGLLDASSTWVMMGPNKGFAYMLSDEKYDVWMANVRGNTYSKNHTTYDTNKAEFWDFSFHEMGVYDIPAIIDYVLEKTRYSQLHYIGHSQGTTCFWIMCSLRPQYNDKIISMQALAPAAFIKACKSPVIKFLAFFRRSLNVLLRIIGTHDFLPSNSFIRRFSEYICKDESIVQQFCSQIMFIIAGYDKQQMNHTMLPVIFGHTPAGASTKQLLHFGQLKSSGRFRQYDHGILKNYKIYGKFSPPDYNLQYVKTKVCLHYGANDWLTIPHDVEQLHQALPNVVGKFLVKFPLFNHLDFVWGIDARDLVYEKVLRLMKLIEDGYL